MKKKVTKKKAVTSADIAKLRTLIEKLDVYVEVAWIKGEKLDPCATWQIIEPFWPFLVKLVALVPKAGGQIGAALTAVGVVLAQVCPAP